MPSSPSSRMHACVPGLDPIIQHHHRAYRLPFVVAGGSSPPLGIRDYIARAAASLNFLLALEAMVELASSAMNTSAATADALRWNQTLQHLRMRYAEGYWNETTGSFAPGAVGLQTLNALAISAQVGTEVQRAKAGEAMIKDVASRGYALSVGAIGSRTLLDVLSDQGDAGHDAALRIVLRREFPGWGYMAVTSKYATTVTITCSIHYCAVA